MNYIGNEKVLSLAFTYLEEGTMKKQLLKSALIAVAGVGLMAGSAMALPSEWGVINPTSLSSGSAASTFDYGYYIWTDDSSRTSWHIRWEGTATTTDSPTVFSGTIALENNTGSFAAVNFDSTDPTTDFIITFAASAIYGSYVSAGDLEGIDFTITQNGSPSYVGFDLFVNGLDMDQNYIYLGSGGQTVANLGEDQDFAIAAPVPEPATMLLFGTGLVGLAGIARRRKAN